MSVVVVAESVVPGWAYWKRVRDTQLEMNQRGDLGKTREVFIHPGDPPDRWPMIFVRRGPTEWGQPIYEIEFDFEDRDKLRLVLRQLEELGLPRWWLKEEAKELALHDIAALLWDVAP